MEEKEVFTLTDYLRAVDNAYATGKANATVEEKENLIAHIKKEAIEWANIRTKSEKSE